VRIPSKQISVLLAVLLSVSFARAQAVKIAAAADLKFARKIEIVVEHW